jgi:D-alanyl-D-alanine dipeptidase
MMAFCTFSKKTGDFVSCSSEPPKESGDFRGPDLVELTKLDPTIKLDIRYATTNNLFGTVFYTEPRAFLQRPAAEALVRVNRQVRRMGYELLVHDAYRPWYVTKVFWDATPAEKKLFVADPAKGSRHNRGAAVDLDPSCFANRAAGGNGEYLR